MNILLLLAGGVGSRAGTGIPKQFALINNKPIIVYTLSKFQRCKLIDAICVVSHKDWVSQIETYKDKFSLDKIKWIVSGGRTGLESVCKGIKSLASLSDKDLILIHDSVRPFITQKAIVDNISVAKQHHVAVTSVPCVETLVKVNSENKSTTQISRDNLMRVMTPQTFELGILRSLFNDIDFLSCNYPSTFALYMSKGYPVYCSYGSERNIKITYPEDIEYFKDLFEN